MAGPGVKGLWIYSYVTCTHILLSRPASGFFMSMPGGDFRTCQLNEVKYSLPHSWCSFRIPPPPHPAQEGTGWVCPGERGEMASLKPPSVPWLLSCRCCSTAILGLHGVSLKPVAGSMPGLLPAPWQCSKSLRHLPLMNHPNGSSDYVRLQFGPQPRATPWQAH